MGQKKYKKGNFLKVSAKADEPDESQISGESVSDQRELSDSAVTGNDRQKSTSGSDDEEATQGGEADESLVESGDSTSSDNDSDKEEDAGDDDEVSSGSAADPNVGDDDENNVQRVADETPSNDSSSDRSDAPDSSPKGTSQDPKRPPVLKPETKNGDDSAAAESEPKRQPAQDANPKPGLISDRPVSSNVDADEPPEKNKKSDDSKKKKSSKNKTKNEKREKESAKPAPLVQPGDSAGRNDRDQGNDPSSTGSVGRPEARQPTATRPHKAGAVEVFKASRSKEFLEGAVVGSRNTRLRARKVRRVVRHVDPWSVLTFSVVFNFVFFGALYIAGLIIFVIASWFSLVDNLEGFIQQMGDYESYEIRLFPLAKSMAIFSFISVLLSTMFLVLLAVIFNLISDLVGGIRVTVVEEDVAIQKKQPLES